VAGKERKDERRGKGERKAKGEEKEKHLKAKKISFIHECSSALCNRLWYLLAIRRTRWTMTFTVDHCLMSAIPATWVIAEWLKNKNT
jgi:hypothetical protein